MRNDWSAFVASSVNIFRSVNDLAIDVFSTSVYIHQIILVRPSNVAAIDVWDNNGANAHHVMHLRAPTDHAVVVPFHIPLDLERGLRVSRNATDTEAFIFWTPRNADKLR